MAIASWDHISAYWASVAGDRGASWAQHIGGDQRHELGAVGLDDRRGHCCCERGLYAAAAASCLCPACLGPDGGRLNPGRREAVAAVIDADAGPCHSSLVSVEH